MATLNVCSRLFSKVDRFKVSVPGLEDVVKTLALEISKHLNSKETEFGNFVCLCSVCQSIHFLIFTRKSLDKDRSNGYELLNVTRTSVDTQTRRQRQGSAHPCTCGRTFPTEKGMKVHRTKKGCANALELAQQRTVAVAAAADKTLEDLGQGNPHSVENAHACRHEEADVHPADVLRAKIKFPPASDKLAWESLDNRLVQELTISLKRASALEEKVEMFGEVVYRHCLQEFGASERKKVACPQLSRRQRRIEEVRRRKNSARKQFRRACESEREGLREIWQKLKEEHSALCRAERFGRNRRRTRMARERFFKDPFQFARSLFEQPRSGSLVVEKEELERHLRDTYSDARRGEPLGSMVGLASPEKPTKAFHKSPPTITEVVKVVQKTSNKSAPGPNGIPYIVYKRCPKVLRQLHKVLAAAWKQKRIGAAWRRANGVYIPKEQKSEAITQFRPISLLNVEGKIFFSIMAGRMTKYLLQNKYVDTVVQKGGIPGVPGCVEHATMIWEHIQRTKVEKSELHVVWLDLANAYGSVPHQLLWLALEKYHVPHEIRTMLMQYFNGFSLRFSTSTFTTGWIDLQVGIAMGCTISPILFVMAMQVILDATSDIAQGPRVSEEAKSMPPLKAFMDDTTIAVHKEDQARAMLSRLDELIRWCRMSFKPQKSRSLSIREGKVVAISFSVANQTIPTVLEEPVKSLGRVYDASMTDKRAVQLVKETTESGLLAIEKSRLVGKFKIWCLQHMLIPKLLWPLLIYDICTSAVEALERKINVATRRWLGVPPGLSDVALYCKGAKLVLPFKSITEEFKVGKTRLAMMLRESADPNVRSAQPALKTGRKWKVKEAIEAAQRSLQLREVMGVTQTDRQGLGQGDVKWYSKASVRERRDMVLQEVRANEETMRVQKAVQQSQQGQWVSWESALQRSLTWNDIWRMAPLRLSFLVRSVYDVLPSATNLVKWGMSDDALCPLCPGRQTLEHVLSSCKFSLAQGRYTWRHNMVLGELASAVDRARLRANKGIRARPDPIRFVKAGQPVMQKSSPGANCIPSFLDDAQDWEIVVDLKGRGNYPDVIQRSRQRPDIVVHSKSTRRFMVIELTVPFESRMESQHLFKEAKYEGLVADLRDSDYIVRFCAVEVGARGLVSTSAYNVLKQLGLNGIARRKALKGMSEAAEKASCWLWWNRNGSEIRLSQ